METPDSHPTAPPIPNPPKPCSEQTDLFASTCWTAILDAQRDSPQASAALERLCGCYWFPLYAYIRRRGHNPTDAEDLTQGFFEFFLENERIRVADRRKGKFRAFLLVALKGYLANQWNHDHALKRGGNRVIISLDEKTAEERYALEPLDNASPAKLFEVHWASQVFERALQRLQDEQVNAGKIELFKHLQPFLTDETEKNDYQVAATALQMTPNSVTVAVCRLRQRYRKLLREEIALTVSHPDQVEEEMRYLFELLAQK